MVITRVDEDGVTWVEPEGYPSFAEKAWPGRVIERRERGQERPSEG
jgi:hypothetical protein